MGDLLFFPGTPRVAMPDDKVKRDCRNCVNARFGATTYCTLVGEVIRDEAAVAPECEAFELEEA